MEILTLSVLVVSFAALVTAHVSLTVALFTRDPWWYGLVALAVPPFALYQCWKERQKTRVVVFLIALSVYLAARVAAAH